ncbi:MAG: tetratricopeptide repeat protein [Xenococcaceae cyanobacterium MO_188.B19]|nr:tetratricopeptide repeat protein [Xenococcaceae cyanobacterium MO_188.B19]
MNITQKLATINNPLSAVENLVIFSHIPKTAGSTVNIVIDSNYEHIFNFYPRRNPSSTKLPDWINDFQEGMTALKDNPKAKLLRGHFGLGVHELLGVDNCIYITVLRDPVDRVISHYYFLDQVENFFDNSDSALSKDNMTLEDFVYQRKSIITDNLQTRFVSGLGWQRNQYKNVWREVHNKNFKVEYGDCQEEMLACAKENLKNYVIFGLQSRFGESLDLFKNVLRWKNVDFDTKRNVNNKKPKRDELDPDLIKFIERENYLDIELHNYALEIFDEQLENLPYPIKVINSQTSWSYPSIPQQPNQQLTSTMKTQLQDVSKTQLQEADQLLEQGAYTEAINKYKEVIQANPEYIPALQKLANGYIQNKAEQQAMSVYERIIELNPKLDKPYAKLARLQAKKGDYTSAIATFKKAINLKSDQPDWVFTGLGDALKKSKKSA